MRRTQIQIDEKTHEALRKAAYDEGRSISSVVRETLEKAFGTAPARKRRQTLKDFPFVGAGRSRDGRTNVSENHDEAFAEAILSRIRR